MRAGPLADSVDSVISYAGSEHAAFVERIKSTGLEKCFRFWLKIKPSGRLPLKHALVMSHLPPEIIRSLFIYELTSDGRFKCRLAGSAIAAQFSKDPTGCYLDELIIPASVPKRTALFQGVLDRQVPVVYGGRLADGLNSWKAFERLLLPIADENGRSSFVFGMVVFSGAHMGAYTEEAGPELDFELWASAAEMDIF